MLPFGLDLKSAIAGMLFGFFLLPMLVGMLGSKLGSRKATAAA